MQIGERIILVKDCGSLKKGMTGLIVADPLVTGDLWHVSIDLDNSIYAVSRLYIAPENKKESVSALQTQEGGTHYKDMKIQPIEFIHANNIPFAEGCAIKYLCRWRSKNGIKDLEKARHFIDLLIELECRDKS